MAKNTTAPEGTQEQTGEQAQAALLAQKDAQIAELSRLMDEQAQLVLSLEAQLKQPDGTQALIESLQDEAKVLLEQRSALTKEVSSLRDELDTVKQELDVAAEVIADLKGKVAEVQSQKGAEIVKGKKVLKAGDRKYTLAFPVTFGGRLVTEDVLAEDEALLAELVASGSGALREVE
ncbi:hypothetical protein [Telluribacter humicola]|uniref:hypothetical protein n=1 Tax=Telluribacter humicola TaxID=1720261 RepID=UPI001A96025D|nr:hypothetical protein [Telluribacter humicola]